MIKNVRTTESEAAPALALTPTEAKPTLEDISIVRGTQLLNGKLVTVEGKRFVFIPTDGEMLQAAIARIRNIKAKPQPLA